MHPRFPVFTNKAKIEKSIFWKDEETGLICKTRPDIWNDSINILCDLKTSISANPHDFPYALKAYDYHIQAAMQIDGVFHATGQLIENFYFLVPPKKEPYMPYIYGIDQKTIEWGRREYKSALKIIKTCTEINKWNLDRIKVNLIELNDFTTNSNSFNHLMERYNVAAY